VQLPKGRAPEEPTANALPPGAAARRAVTAPLLAAASLSRPGASTSLEYARATLRDEGAQTALAMIRIGRLVGGACLLALPWFGGGLAIRVALGAAVVFAVAIGFVVERRVRDVERYSDRVMVLLALSVAPATFIAVLYFGVFSAAQLFPAISLYFFARREQLASTIALYAINATAQALFATVIIAHVVPDPGLFRPELPAQDLIVGHLLIQVGHLGAFLLGRRSFRAAQEALEKMQHAMLLAAQREALLVEARQELDRALRIGGPGRYSEHTFGTYRLGDVIGRGGMGEVYEAFHVDTGDAAAVKLLAPRELANPSSVERFLREMRAVRQLASPHVVRVIASSDEGDPIPYLVMERLHGHDLAHHLRAGKIPPAGLDEMLAQVGAAVEEAWQHGIVHRDLKPQNLYLADAPGRPIWKVLDFGVAALIDHSGTLTQDHVVGTPAYMAPEQARGERVDFRADVYALGAIAYRWITGRPVCAGKDLHASLYQVVHVMPQRPSSLADIPDDVDLTLALALAKQPADRFASVTDLRAALASALRGELDPALRERAREQLVRHPWAAVRS